MPDYIDLYGPDGALIYRRPRYMDPEALAKAAGGVLPFGATGASLRDQADQVTAAQQARGSAVEGKGNPYGLGFFGPGAPVTPAFPPGTAPRVWQYPSGYNIYQRPRAGAPVSFSTLRELAQTYEIARLCINVRIDEVTSLDWDIVPKEAGRNLAGKYEAEIAKARAFFESPDREHPFDAWLRIIAEDWLTIDAVSIFKRRTRSGKLYALEPIDGATIKPVIDRAGRTPAPPYVSYEQYLYGIKWVEMSTDELLYRPFWRRAYTPYGMPPLEWLLLNANTDMRLRLALLQYYTEGNVPEGFGSVPENWSPSQVEEWQNIWDALMAGDQSWKSKIRFVPGGFSFTRWQGQEFTPELPLYLMKITCAGFSVSPNELGFTDDVNKSSSDSQEDVQYRRAIKPTTRFFEQMLTQVLNQDLGLPMLRFQFQGVEEEEDQLKLAQVTEIHIRNGIVSPDEVREELGLPVDQDHKVGRFLVASTAIPLAQLADPTTTPGAGARAAAGVPVPGKEQGDEPPDAKGGDDDEPDAGGDKGGGHGGVTAAPDSAGGGAVAQAVDADMRKWEDNCRYRLRVGKGPRQFTSAAIPGGVHDGLLEQLRSDWTKDGIRRAFGDARDLLAKARPIRPAAAATRERDLAALLAGFLPGEGRRIAAYVVQRAAGRLTGAAGKAEGDPLEEYLWDRWLDIFLVQAPAVIAGVFRAGEEQALASLGVGSVWDVGNPAAEAWAANRCAQLVGRRPVQEDREFRRPDGSTVRVRVPTKDGTGRLITTDGSPEFSVIESTRDWVRGQVEGAIRDGDSPQDLQRAIEDHYGFSPSRAQNIARTETATALNAGTLQGYADEGSSKVLVQDGDYDEACQRANGQVWTIEEAQARPLEHPNCQRVFLPYFGDADEEGDG